MLIASARFLRLTKEPGYLEDVAAQAQVTAMEKVNDDLVYDLYGLTAEEITLIKSQLKGKTEVA